MARAWKRWHQLGGRVRPVLGDACLVGKGGRPAAVGLRGSNPAPSCFAGQGRSGECRVTCGSRMPAVTDRARRGPAVPDAVRTQHGPGSRTYRGLGKYLGRDARLSQVGWPGRAKLASAEALRGRLGAPAWRAPIGTHDPSLHCSRSFPRRGQIPPFTREWLQDGRARRPSPPTATPTPTLTEVVARPPALRRGAGGPRCGRSGRRPPRCRG
jgi:hypothetical protein